MDERIRKLVAIGAAAAVNCRPCVEHYLAECDRLGIDRKEVSAAVDIGVRVNQGACAKTKDYVQGLLDGEKRKGAESGCGCT